MATQRAIAAHLVLSVSRIQQLQYKGVVKKDASLDCARLAYIHWLRGRSTSLAALDEETRRSKLIPADEINSEWAEMTSRVKYLKPIYLPPQKNKMYPQKTTICKTL